MSDTPLAKPMRRRRGRRRAGLLALLGAGAMFLAGALGFLALTGAPIRVPGWVTERVEARLNAGLSGGGRVSVGGLEVAVDRLIPRLRMRNVGIYDARGLEVARLNEVGARLEAPALLRGTVELHTLRVSGALITVRRLPDGTFDLSFGARAGATGTLAGVLDDIESVFATGPLARLRAVTADGLTISLEDARSGRVWQVTDGRIELEHAAQQIGLTITADVFNGTDELATTVLRFETEKDSPRAAFSATFENATAADIAAQSPALAFLEVLDAPISGGVSGEIGADGRVQGLGGTLKIGAGALQPVPEAEPIRIDGAEATFAYDAVARRLSFDRLSLRTAAAEGQGSGQAFLRDFRGEWPETLVAQFQFSAVSVQPTGLFAEPMRFDRGAVSFRLRLNPFTVEIGQLALTDGDRRTLGNGRVSADINGWNVALDVTVAPMPLDRILALWPVSVARNTRDWVAQHVFAGEISDLAGAFRLSPDAPRGSLSISFSFDGAQLKPLKNLPDITGAAGYASLTGSTFTVVLEEGQLEAPEGGQMDLAGSFMRVPDVTVSHGRAEITVKADSTVTAALSLLDKDPFRLLSNAGLGPNIAQGRADLLADVRFDMTPDLTFADVEYNVAGRLTEMSSDVLVPGRDLRAERLEIRANPSGVAISGRGQLGTVGGNVVWSQEFGPGAGGGRVEGLVELGPTFLEEFGIGLPEGSVSGDGLGTVAIQLGGEAPTFRLVSDLNRLALRLDALGWSKPLNRTGRLEVEGRLGADPSIDRIVLEAPGLEAEGRIDLSVTGGLARAQFDRVRVGDWLRGPVTLIGRGANLAPAIQVNGGVVDLRAAAFGGGGGGGGESGPMALNLDRLIVTEGIAFTSFRGQFESRGGLQGRFTARINGRTPVTGSVVATPAGSAVRLFSDDAGGALAASGLLKNARAGTLDLTLNPTGREGVYDGRLAIRRTRIVEAPAMTELLSAISIVGLIDQMNTGGISMSEIDAEFQISPTRVTVYRSSGVGPSLGISLDGYMDLTTGRIDMQGVISPVYFLNGIGQLFSRRGEGLFGFNFRLRGPADDPAVSVNPLSVLTPGMFREIFRRPPPQPGQ